MQPALAPKRDIPNSGDAPDPIVQTAERLAEMLAAGRPVRRETLRDLMTAATGRSDADGGWTMRDSYDAIELAQVLFVTGSRTPIDDREPVSTLRRLQHLVRSLPTQTYRAEEQVDLQAFSTPLPLAWLAGRAARLSAADLVLEPSAGTGLLACFNAVEAWLSSLPGQVYANVRQPLVHTLNLAHLMPLSSVWAGPERNEHLGGPPLLLAETSGSTPFRLSTHVGDVGHMLVVGPTGAGKSVLLSLLAMQFRRYRGAAVYIFDKGWSARAAILAMNGAHHALGIASEEGEETLAFQPLRRIHEAAQRSWAMEWLGALLEHQKLELKPELKDSLWSALLNLASAPPEERTLTGLSMLLQSNAVKAALQPYTLEGPFGALLDAAEDRLSIADVHCFEMEALMGEGGAVSPVLTYLFHRLEERFDGRPTLLVLDEAWVFLDNPLFAARIREWLKVLRKKNVSVVFATQSLADIADSKIAPAIIESCPQRIFLANDRAVEPQARAAYERFGLNDRQIELIARAAPKRHYYLQSRRGNRLFELSLGPIALAFCAASGPASQQRIDSIFEGHGRERFARAWLESRGLSWAAAVIGDFDKLSPAGENQ